MSEHGHACTINAGRNASKAAYVFNYDDDNDDDYNVNDRGWRWWLMWLEVTQNSPPNSNIPRDQNPLWINKTYAARFSNALLMTKVIVDTTYNMQRRMKASLTSLSRTIQLSRKRRRWNYSRKSTEDIYEDLRYDAAHRRGWPQNRRPLGSYNRAGGGVTVCSRPYNGPAAGEHRTLQPSTPSIDLGRGVGLEPSTTTRFGEGPYRIKRRVGQLLYTSR